MRRFYAEISIMAPAETVWTLLTNAAGYPDWNTTVDKVEGEIALGEKIRIFTKIQPGRSFPVRVVDYQRPRRMVWSGGMPFGLFKGERVFELVSVEGGVCFTMEERFTGFLSGLIGKSIPDLQPSFDEFATCLKTSAEKQPKSPRIVM